MIGMFLHAISLAIDVKIGLGGNGGAAFSTMHCQEATEGRPSPASVTPREHDQAGFPATRGSQGAILALWGEGTGLRRWGTEPE